jgi:hypothetical protein
LSSTWEYRNGSWTLYCSACGPSSRWDAGLSFFAGSGGGYFLLFGGCPPSSSLCSGAFDSDSWRFTGAGWQLDPLVHPTTHPSGRADFAMAYDSLDKVIVLYGGFCSGGPICGDTWLYYGGNSPYWSHMTGTGWTVGDLYGASAVWDAVDGYVLMAGGMSPGTGSGNVVSAASYTFTLSGKWSGTGLMAFPVYDGMMVYDPNAPGVIQFGGIGPTGVAQSSTYYFRAGTWQTLLPSTSPTAMWSASAIYDPAAGPMGEVVLFGGDEQGSVWTAPASPSPGGLGVGSGDEWLFFFDPFPTSIPVQGGSLWAEAGSYT